jgi:hypothetical protein
VLRIDPMLKIDLNNKNLNNRIINYDDEQNDEFGNKNGQIEQPEQKLDHYETIRDKIVKDA